MLVQTYNSWGKIVPPLSSESSGVLACNNLDLRLVLGLNHLSVMLSPCPGSVTWPVLRGEQRTLVPVSVSRFLQPTHLQY